MKKGLCFIMQITVIKKKAGARGQGEVFLEICQNLSIFLPELPSVLLAQKFLHEMTPFRLFQRSLCALERTLLSQYFSKILVSCKDRYLFPSKLTNIQSANRYFKDSALVMSKVSYRILRQERWCVHKKGNVSVVH